MESQESKIPQNDSDDTAERSPELMHQRLHFLALKSADYINKQVEAFRHRRQLAATIVPLLAVFLTFFLSRLDGVAFWIKIVAIIPALLSIVAAILLLVVTQGLELLNGINPAEFSTLVNQTLQDVLIKEIEANKSSFELNEVPLHKSYQRYLWALRLTIAAIITSNLLLITDKFTSHNRETYQIHLTNPPIVMEREKKIVLKPVPESKLVRIQQGATKPTTSK